MLHPRKFKHIIPKNCRTESLEVQEQVLILKELQAKPRQIKVA